MARGQSRVTLAVGSGPQFTIPDDFLGLSFETSNVLPDGKGQYLFSEEDRSLIAIFRTLGIRSLRVGGNMADRPTDVG